MPAARSVVDAWRGGGTDHRDDLAGDVDGPGGLAVLVVDDIDGGLLALQPDHRTSEIRPVRPEKPRGPHHVAGSGQPTEYGPLTRQLGTPVGGARRRNIVFGVRSTRVPGKDVVGRDLHHAGPGRCAARGQAGRSAGVDGQRLLLCRLSVVDSGPGRAVYDHVRAMAGDRVGYRGSISHIQPGPVHPGYRLAQGYQGGYQIGAEHAAAPGDQPPRHGLRCQLAAAPGGGPGTAPGCLSGSHQPRLSAYQRTVASRPWRNGTRGEYPIARRALSLRE